jgi:site-specific DNA-methyltransferase (adenine-specific)
VTPIHYVGTVWCVKVPTGAFVARRNGKVFVTGNSGFPKSLNVSIAIDKAAGAMGHRGKRVSVAGNRTAGGEDVPHAAPVDAHEPITDDARRWSGWGTALKPAFEPIVVARKPLAGTVAANVLKYGTGAMNIDGCRVPTTESLNGGAYSGGARPMSAMGLTGEAGGTSSMLEAGGGRLNPEDFKQPEGRWPANLIMSHDVNCDEDGCVPGCPCALMDEQSGGDGASRYFNNLPIEEDDYPPFFYAAKASRKEREAGCEILPEKTAQEAVFRDPESAGAKNPRAGANRGAGAPLYYCTLCDVSLQGGRAAKECAASENGEHVPEARGTTGAIRNLHPTVKPLSVMSWLVTLVTPPNGVVMDPFMGSGTTGIAAVKNGFSFIGCEQSEEYLAIAEARIRHHGGDPEVIK